MKSLMMAALGLICAAGMAGMAMAGSIDSPGVPSAGSGMYSLSQVYNYLNSGIDVTPVPDFQEPGAAPGPTMKTMKDIYDDIKAKYIQCPATADNVESGVKFFCTQSGSWGVQTGTYLGPPTATPTITPTPWTLNADNCNATTGWHWYTTNTRSACWSKTLADSVSWNKVGGNDPDNPGVYNCATGYSLQQRMAAAAAGEWYKIVSDVNSVVITSGDNGQTGASKISALAIADCVDGTRDLCSTDGCLGSSWSTINSSLRTWAGATGKSALPYLGDDAGSSGKNDYETACSPTGEDPTLGCGSGSNYFYLNRKACGDSDANYSWGAACGDTSGGFWTTCARTLGCPSCSGQSYGSTSDASGNISFRVVARP